MKKTILTIVLATMLCIVLAACGNTKSKVEITGVTDSLELNAPDGFSLTVTVNDPSQVQSYQWQLARAEIIDDDGKVTGYDWYDLNGSSATTDTLVCPSTSTADSELIYRCVVTDTAGTVQYSDLTSITLTNGQETTPYVSLGEIAVRPGETVDLADTAMGTGTISLNEAGDTAVMQDVHYNNAAPLYDNEMPSQGFCFCDYNTSTQVFTLDIEGDCVLDNVMFQEDYNTGGLTVLFNIWGAESKLETAKITGDGTLTIRGGGANIYADCSVDIDCNLVLDSYDTHYTDGIRVLSDIRIHDCSITAEKLNGRIAFSNYGSVTLSNCTIDAVCNVPCVSQGASAYRAVSGTTGIEITGCDIDISVAVHGDWLPNGLGQVVGLYCEETAAIENSNVKLTFTADGTNENLYNLLGLYAQEGMTVTESSVNCKADTVLISNATGINTENLAVSDSDIAIDINGSGTVYGVADTGKTSLTNAQLTVSAVNDGTTENDEIFGMMVYGFGMEGSSSQAHITVNKGPALGIYLGYGEEAVSYDADYNPTGILAPYSVEIPAQADMNEYSLPGYDVYTYVETVYAAGDTENPAQEVLLKTK